MGAINFSIDPMLAELLAHRLGIATFVETGTFRGDSVDLVRRFFAEIHTCELSVELHHAARARFQDDPLVHCHRGSSPDVLKSLVQQMTEKPILFWLDAHWCAADRSKVDESQCPLLEELEAITPLHPKSVVWIDDARYFMAPPPKPMDSHRWPTFNQVLDRLQRMSPESRQIVFANDTILLYPAEIETEIRDYLKAHGVDWLAVAHSARVLPEAIAGRDVFMLAYEKIKNQQEEACGPWSWLRKHFPHLSRR